MNMCVVCEETEARLPLLCVTVSFPDTTTVRNLHMDLWHLCVSGMWLGNLIWAALQYKNIKLFQL